MATLYDLAMKYLQQGLPSISGIFPSTIPPIGGTPPTQPPGTPPGTPPGQGQGIINTGAADNFTVYNPDPTRLRTIDNYSPYAGRQAIEKTFYDTTTAANKMMDMYPDYYGVGQKTGIERVLSNLPGKNILDKFGQMLPVNKRAIMENEALGAGFRLNDIGQIVSDGGSAYDPSGLNIMAGYNLAKVDQSTFDKRRANAKKNMSPEGFEKFNKALTAAEEKILGKKGVKEISDLIYDDRMKTKNPDYKSTDELIDLGIKSAEDDNEDDMVDTIIKQQLGIIPTFGSFPGYGVAPNQFGSADDFPTITQSGTSDDGYIPPSPPKDTGEITADGGGGGTYYSGGKTLEDAGGTYTGGFQGAEGGFEYTGKPSFGTGSGGLGDYQISPSKPSLPNYGPPSQSSGGGGGSSSSSSKIVCTMMNDSYGFGSFRNKIWIKYAKDNLRPEHQKGYHKIFLPLVRYAKQKGVTNKIVKKVLEHIAVHRTIDIRQQSRGKTHLLGRVYRKILEPICYFVGKNG